MEYAELPDRKIALKTCGRQQYAEQPSEYSNELPVFLTPIALQVPSF